MKYIKLLTIKSNFKNRQDLYAENYKTLATNFKEGPVKGDAD